MNGDSKELKFDPETSILKGLRGRLEKLEQHVRPDLNLTNEILIRLNKLEEQKSLQKVNTDEILRILTRVHKLEAEKPTIDQIRRTYVLNKIDMRIDKLEALHKTDKPAEFRKGPLNRVKIKCKDGHHVILEFDEWEAVCEEVKKHQDEYEVTEREDQKKITLSPSPDSPFSLIEPFMEEENGIPEYDDMFKQLLTSFIAWLDKNGYEIREKKL